MPPAFLLFLVVSLWAAEKKKKILKSRKVLRPFFFLKRNEGENSQLYSGTIPKKKQKKRAFLLSQKF